MTVSASGEISFNTPRDDIDELRDHCRAFLDEQSRSTQVALARSKMDEMIFWLRANRSREARGQ